MTRPRKMTVEWFPHSSNHGKTMFTLEKRYGIAGYGFWFKLLEILANSEGHFIDASNLATLEFVSAYTYTEKDSCLEILNLLSTLDAIDPDLWKNKIIWSDNFVQGLLPLYRKRDCGIPEKPDNRTRKPQTLGQKDPETRRGRRVEEGEEGEKDIAPPGTVVPADAAPPSHPFFVCPYFVVGLDYRMKLAKEYPALNDELLLKELSKAEDWVSDNADKKKFRANGHLHNPKLFIKNWLDKVKGITGPGRKEPKGFAGLREYAKRSEGA